MLEACLAFCIPSTIEGLSITLLEAMSHGRICIASDIPANKEALGDSGVWCKYEDVDDLASKIIFVATNYDKIAWQEYYNLKRIKERFIWRTVAEQYASYLHRIVAN